MPAGMMLNPWSRLDLEDFRLRGEHRPRQRQHRDHERKNRCPLRESREPPPSLCALVMDVDVDNH
jgi:hypothetical protein